MSTMNELTGGRCTACGHIAWPMPAYCSEGCGATVQPVALANEATIYVDSVINVPHPVFGSSYHVGYADLESGPRIFGHFDSLDPVELGTAVSIELREIADPADPERVVRTVVFTSRTERVSA